MEKGHVNTKLEDEIDRQHWVVWVQYRSKGADCLAAYTVVAPSLDMAVSKAGRIHRRDFGNSYYKIVLAALASLKVIGGNE